MKSLVRMLQPPSRCEYLHSETWQLEIEEFESLSREEYSERLHAGWRRFGHTLLRPQCPRCKACRSLRIRVSEFEPNRSQQRALKNNRDAVRLSRGEPDLTQQIFDLYRRYHEHQHALKLWTPQGDADPFVFLATFVIHPFKTEAWTYTLNDELVGTGYVDVLPDGLSAIYFFYDPNHRSRSLGTFNVLSIVEEAKRRGLPYVYLGYYVAGSPSMAYKANFRPYELLEEKGWHSAP